MKFKTKVTKLKIEKQFLIDMAIILFVNIASLALFVLCIRCLCKLYFYD